MKLIVGLGNPGPQYARTRHNAGFMVLDRILKKLNHAEPVKSRFSGATAEVTLAGERCLLLKPLTFMNRSGPAVAEAVRFYKLPLTDLLVVVDDFYLPVGAVRIRPAGGAGGHNGLGDIELALATDTYPRLRVGVGLKPSGGKPPLMDQADFVLSRFTAEEEPDLDASIVRAADACEVFASRGLDAAMNRFNAPDKPQPQPQPKPPPKLPRDTPPRDPPPPADRTS